MSLRQLETDCGAGILGSASGLCHCGVGLDQALSSVFWNLLQSSQERRFRPLRRHGLWNSSQGLWKTPGKPGGCPIDQIFKSEKNPIRPLREPWLA